MERNHRKDARTRARRDRGRGSSAFSRPLSPLGEAATLPWMILVEFSRAHPGLYLNLSLYPGLFEPYLTRVSAS